MDTAPDPRMPGFSVREINGVCFVVALWPAGQEEFVKACGSRVEGERWINSQSAGWVKGRTAPDQTGWTSAQ